MPSAPGSVFPPFTPGTPDAPGNITGDHTPASPTAPGSVVVDHSAGSPDAPGNVAGDHAPGSPTAPGSVVGNHPIRPPEQVTDASVAATATIGGSVTADTGTWRNLPTFTYQWFVNDVLLLGATANPLTVPSMSGELKCRVTASNGIGDSVVAWTGVCAVYDADLVTFASAATADPITVRSKKVQLDEWFRCAKAVGFWNNLAFYAARSGFGAGYPAGPAGYSGSTYAGNRNSTRWTITGGSFGADGTTLALGVGANQTQYLGASYAPFSGGNNPAFGSIVRVDDPFPASEAPGSYIYGNAALTTVIATGGQSLSVINLSAPVAGYGGASRNYAPWSLQGAGANAFGYCANTNAGDGGSSRWTGCSPVSSPTLLLSYRSVGENVVHAVRNSIADTNLATLYTQESFAAYANNIRFTAPAVTNGHTGVLYAAVLLYGTKAQIAALPLAQIWPVMATTYLRDLVDYVCHGGFGQSNETAELTAADFGAPGGVADLKNVSVSNINANFGGEAISHYLIASATNTGNLQADRQTDSDAAYNSPTNGFRMVTASNAFAAILPTNALALGRTTKVLSWNQGESDTEYRFEALRYQANLTQVIARLRAIHGSDVRIIYHLVDYDPPFRTASGNNLTISGLTGGASGANGTYAIQAAAGETDYNVAYVFTKGTYTLQIASGNWELRNSGTLIMTGSATNAAHPELVASWTFATGGGTPAFAETRTGNIEQVRQAIRNVAAADALGWVIDTRPFPRDTDPGGDPTAVHYYNTPAAVVLHAAAMKTVFQSSGFLLPK
ncbi:hypothetical protein [Luteolibacter sp. LG18]|uniref:hypothetical protein n=1 Tax=Luteolibacter sp. LG18 TaxID=2819286 RepID=UPI002B2FADC7|nr:hypothetical protein llg_06970 [Luteolibacter sp. LG18]BCU79674.1 hypothetical protein llg_43890 [Luteolibacter sp. LG18]